MSELKNCPFCGGDCCEMQYPQVTVGYNTETKYSAGCPNCGVWTDYCDTEEEAITAWNRRADRWISVSERLPENPNNWVLVYADEAMNCMMYDEVNNKFYDPTYSKWHNICIEDVTHWMPLPEPPEGVERG